MVITDDVRHLVDDPDWDCSYKHDAWEFIRDLVDQYDNNQVPVDAEWLDETWLKSGPQYTWHKFADECPVLFDWNFRKSALSTTTLQVRFIGETEDCGESWAVYANNVLLKCDPTRGDVRKLLAIMDSE